MSADRKSGPYVLGLTGSIGMGKTTVAQIFAELGVPTFNADEEVHRMQGPGGSLIPAIEEAFPGTTGPHGVDRKKLAEIVFSDPARLRELEGIVHPAVRNARKAFLDANQDKKLIVFDIPLLFETGQAEQFDGVAVVSAPPEIQRERVLARPDMTPERFEEILRFQTPDAEKRSRAEFVIDTGCPLEQTRKAVAELVGKLTG